MTEPEAMLQQQTKEAQGPFGFDMLSVFISLRLIVVLYAQLVYQH